MSDDCLFCQIASGEAESDVVAEGDRWLAFRDVNPQAPSHVLVIPREHVENLDDLDPDQTELAGELLMAARRVAEQEGLDEGYRVVANTNRQAGQSVFHLHFHVLGGRAMGWPPG
ncbi:MAG: histidine triad nucleotide-binding protein [Gemmatimonadota bacterium]